MTVIEHINNVLKKIVVDGSTFNIAIKSSLKTERRENIHAYLETITSVCGSYLRHFYAISESVKANFPSLNENAQAIIGITLSDQLFSKKLKREDFAKYIKKEAPEQEREIIAYLDSCTEPFKLMPEDVKSDSDEYIHLRFNLPLFLVKMWRKNCKMALSRKLFKSFKINDERVLRVDTNVISFDEFFLKYPEYTRVEEYPLVFASIKQNPKKLPPVVNGHALNMHAGYTYALNTLDVDFVRGVAVYAASNNEILDELYAKYGEHIKLDYLCGNQKHFFDTKKAIEKYHLNDVSIYECGFDALRTCISKPVHTFILCPENTSYQRLREESDYFLRVKQESLDTFIANEKVALENAAELVEESGYLLYIIPTLCRNETYGLIHTFVNEHRNFSLEKETQLFPFDKFNSMIYFAVLKKEIKND